MNQRILITGGAGFIGSHLTDRLIARGDSARILDNLDPQIHPQGKPGYLNSQAEFIEGDVRDRDTFFRALEGVDAVIHLAAVVGTGQSMYQIKKYSDVNMGGLSCLLDILAETGARPKILFPGSATSYGECAHRCAEHGMIFPELRSLDQLQKRDWDVRCPICHTVMEPVPTPEEQPLRPRFVYGLQKKAGEELLSAVAAAYNIPFTILRFFNVYGPRQSLSNPYTGVIPIFSARIKNGHAPVVIEDGRESRDFISVHDIVDACLKSVDNPNANGQTLNVGSGRRVGIADMANLLVSLHGSQVTPVVNQEFRKNDFRHSQADISKIRQLLDFEPTVTFEAGMQELYEWTKEQEAVDTFDQAYQELRERGMVNAPTGTPTEPRVAAVILNWNGLADTIECIESLRQSSYHNLKIIVVDNGSKEPEAAALSARFSDAIEIVANEKNLGVAGGNNSGLARALRDSSVDYCLMMNNDLVVEQDAVAALVKAAEADTAVGMVASRIMNFFQRDQVDSLGIFLLTSGLGYNRKTEAMPLFCPCSGFALYRAKALQEIAHATGEIWDNDFFAYGDELDVGFRLRLRGYTAAYANNAVVYHKEGASSGGAQSDFTLFHGHRNNLWFIAKDFPTPFLWRFGWSILATQLGTFLLYLKRRRLGVIARAKWASLRGLPRMLKKRREVQALLKVPVSEVERLMVRRAYVRPEALPALVPGRDTN